MSDDRRCVNCSFSRTCSMYRNLRRIIRSSVLPIYLENEKMEEYIDLFALICPTYIMNIDDDSKIWCGDIE